MGRPADKSDPCRICLKHYSIMNSHHTVPRSRGGEDSEQIPLCCTCHDTLHAKAVYLVSRIKRNATDPVRSFWSNPDDEQRAEPYLQILVSALLLPIPEGLERQHLVSAEVSSELFGQLKLLQFDLGFKSLNQTLEFAFTETLKRQGIMSDGKESGHSPVWFVQLPGAGKGYKRKKRLQ